MYTPYDVVTWRNEPSRCSKKTPNNSSALLAAALQPMRCACTTPSQQQTNTHLYRFLNLIRSTPNTLNARKLTISMLLSDYFAFEDVPNNLIVIISFFFSERCADQWLRQKGTVSDRHTKVIQELAHLIPFPIGISRPPSLHYLYQQKEGTNFHGIDVLLLACRSLSFEASSWEERFL